MNDQAIVAWLRPAPLIVESHSLTLFSTIKTTLKLATSQSGTNSYWYNYWRWIITFKIVMLNRTARAVTFGSKLLEMKLNYKSMVYSIGLFNFLN